MLKASSSQQIENKTNEILQQVEFDATLNIPISSTSEKSSTLEVTSRFEGEVIFVDVPQEEEITEDVEHENETIAIRRLKRAIKKPRQLIKDMTIVMHFQLLMMKSITLSMKLYIVVKIVSENQSDLGNCKVT